MLTAIISRRLFSTVREELVVEAVAELEEDFARVEEMRAAKSEAVVEEHAAVRDVDGLDTGGKTVTETLAQRQIEGGMARQMVGAARDCTADSEAGGIVDVGGCIAAPRQSELAANMKRVALIVIEETKAWWRRGAGRDQPAG